MKDLFILKDVKSGEEIFIGTLNSCKTLQSMMAWDGVKTEII